MSDRDDDDRLQAYIERLTELEPRQGPTLGAEGLAEIAREMGVDEALLKRAETHAEHCLQRGKSLLAARRYGEAIANLRVAVDLRPYDAEVADVLSRAHSMRSRMRMAIGAAACALIGVVAGIVFVVAQPPAPAPLPAPTVVARTAPPTVPPPPIAPAQRVLTKSPPPPPVVERRVRHSNSQPPVELMADKRLAGATLVNVRSELRVHTTSSWYDASFELLWRGDRELGQLELLAEALDATGAVIVAKTLRVIRRSGPPARPGDRLPMRLLMRSTAAQKKLRIKPLVVFTQPAASSYPDGDPVALNWQAKAPVGIVLKAVIRNEQSRAQFGSKHFHSVTLEIQNNGERAARLVKLQVRYTDKAGEVIDTVDTYLLITSSPPFLPGTTRLSRAVKIVRQRPHAWSLWIVDAR